MRLIFELAACHLKDLVNFVNLTTLSEIMGLCCIVFLNGNK
jgi:hypothetical protein